MCHLTQVLSYQFYSLCWYVGLIQVNAGWLQFYASSVFVLFSLCGILFTTIAYNKVWSEAVIMFYST